MAMNKGHKMRVWSDDQNRLIYTQTTVQGVSVARRFAMNASHDPRLFEGSEVCAGARHQCGGGYCPGFLPVKIAGTITVPCFDEGPQLDVAVSADRVAVTL